MKSSMIAHLIGCVGELLNLIGGFIFGLDLLTKKREREVHGRLTLVNEWAVENQLHSATYKGDRVTSTGFIVSIFDRRSALRGYIGLIILLLGFALLLAYHLMEMM